MAVSFYVSISPPDIFQNPEDLSEFQKYKLLTKENYQVIPGSGIDLQHFQYTPLPESSPFTFLMLARLLEDKGVREFVGAARLVKDQYPSVRFVLAGNPEASHQRGIPLQDLNQWQQSGAIEYLGELEDVRPSISQAHVVVLPSYREGLPKSLLEAAAMGRPIIASDVPGCREVVIDQINGLLCQPRDIQNLAHKMMYLMDQPTENMAQMGIAARKHIADHFDEKIVISGYLNEIESILNLHEV